MQKLVKSGQGYWSFQKHYLQPVNRGYNRSLLPPGTLVVSTFEVTMSAFNRITSLTALTVMFLLAGSAAAQSGPYGVVSPTTVNFGQVLVGQTSPQQRVRLKNTGTSELIVSSISISGYYAGCRILARPFAQGWDSTVAALVGFS
jgi:hypothetical protein